MSKRFVAVSSCLCCMLLLSINTSLGSAKTLENSEHVFAEAEDIPCFTSGKYRQEKKLAFVEKPLVSTGSFIFSCEHGLIWHTRSPVIETIIYSKAGKNFKIIEKEKAESLNGHLHRHLSKLLVGMIGKNSTYISKNFTTKVVDESTELTPKKNRLKKFIQSINILEKKNTADITLLHNEEQKTMIHIYDKISLVSLDLPQCKNTLADQNVACDYLFQ